MIPKLFLFFKQVKKKTEAWVGFNVLTDCRKKIDEGDNKSNSFLHHKV